jgi:hypothetical protein
MRYLAQMPNTRSLDFARDDRVEVAEGHAALGMTRIVVSRGEDASFGLKANTRSLDCARDDRVVLVFQLINGTERCGRERLPDSADASRD